MKRFTWPLQRLLGVTIQRQRALRAELFRLSRELARVRQEIVRRKATLRAMLSDLGDEEFQVRLPRQQVVLSCSAAAEKEMKKLQVQLGALEQHRKELTDQFVKVKAKRESLERLREEAYQRYLKDLSRLEQKQLDDSAQIAFARKLLRRGVPAAN